MLRFIAVFIFSVFAIICTGCQSSTKPVSGRSSVFAAALELGKRNKEKEKDVKEQDAGGTVLAAAPAVAAAEIAAEKNKTATVPKKPLKEEEPDISEDEVAAAKKIKKRKQPKIEFEHFEHKEEFEPAEEFDDQLVTKERAVRRNETPDVVPQYPLLAQLPGANPIIQASYPPAFVRDSGSIPIPTGYGAGDWQTPMRTAAEQLRYAIDCTPNGKTPQNEMRLRLVETVLGNKSEAARTMTSADKFINEFMGNEVLGLSVLLDENPGVSPNSKTKYITAAYRFREANAELSKLCPIKIKNVVFIKDMQEFGKYIVRSEDYKPGEKFLVYLELDHPTVRQTADGYNVCVAINYELRDNTAKIVAAKDGDKPSLTTSSRKQDYCLALVGDVPKTLQPGTYQLRVSITDLNDESNQYSEEQIPIKVAPATETPE